MRSPDELRAEIKRIKADERYNYPPADIHINGYLAIMQIEWKSRVQALEWALADSEKA
jgi:hypothetical protein